VQYHNTRERHQRKNISKGTMQANRIGKGLLGTDWSNSDAKILNSRPSRRSLSVLCVQLLVLGMLQGDSRAPYLRLPSMPAPWSAGLCRFVSLASSFAKFAAHEY
jgi:hypothetical protein